MPQTPTGRILFAAVILSGGGGGYSMARMITDTQERETIEGYDVRVAPMFGALLLTSGLLIDRVEGL